MFYFINYYYYYHRHYYYSSLDVTDIFAIFVESFLHVKTYHTQKQKKGNIK